MKKILTYGVGMLVAFLLFTTQSMAECPTDIHPTAGETGFVEWTSVPTPFHYSIPGNIDCIIDIYYCKRIVPNGHGGTIVQYFIDHVSKDPDTDPSACDGIDLHNLIKYAVDGIFQEDPNPTPCGASGYKIVSVYRRSCFKMLLEPWVNSSGTTGYDRIVFGCPGTPVCEKTCSVCFNPTDGMNHTSSCVYELHGTTPDCASAPPVWLENTCYFIPCAE